MNAKEIAEINKLKEQIAAGAELEEALQPFAPQRWQEALGSSGTVGAVSQLLAEIPEIAELDINPLIVNFEGAIALDARIRVSATGPAGADHFAIRPYPAQLEEQVLWQGRSVCLRPIRPEDEAQHMAFLQALDPEDVRMRVFYSRRSMARSELARLVQIDYAREMIFGALIVWFLIVEPHGLAKLWSVAKQKLRLWPFPH